MKLKNTLFLVFFLFMILPVCILIISATNYYGAKMTKIIENDLSVATLTQMEAIHNFLEEREADTSTISGLDSVQRLLQQYIEGNRRGFDESKKDIESMLQTFVDKNLYIFNLSIVDENFNIIAGTKRFHSGELSALKDIEKEELSSGKSIVSVIDSYARGKNQKVLAVVNGVFNRHQQIIGYVVEEVDIAYFNKVRMAVNLFNDGTIYLVDDSGNILSAGSGKETVDDYVMQAQELEGFKAYFKNAIQGNSGYIRYEVEGTKYLSYYFIFQEYGWTLISSISLEQVLHTKSDYINLFLFMGAVSIMLMAMVHQLITARVTDPLERIIQTFKQIKQSQDYSIRMEHTNSIEMNIITGEINSLLANVESNLRMERQKQKNLIEIASIDPLTGLYNKKAIEEIISSRLAQQHAGKVELVCFFIDVDDFKEVNTSYGHMGGDKILRFVADTLRETFDFSGRIGGDEFIACIEGETAEEIIYMVASHLKRVLSEGIAIEDEQAPVCVKCSIGAVKSDIENLSYEQLIVMADKAMYEVKNNSKDDIYIYKP